MRTTLNVPGLSLHKHTRQAEQAVAGAVRETQSGPREPFSADDIDNAWTKFIDTNGTEQLLVNTMRSHVPTCEGEKLTVTVGNKIQGELLAEALPTLQEYMRKSLRNYAITLAVTVDEDTTNPRTWNEREVLADIVRRHPGISTFVSELNLTLE